MSLLSTRDTLSFSLFLSLSRARSLSLYVCVCVRVSVRAAIYQNGSCDSVRACKRVNYMPADAQRVYSTTRSTISVLSILLHNHPLFTFLWPLYCRALLCQRCDLPYQVPEGQLSACDIFCPICNFQVSPSRDLLFIFPLPLLFLLVLRPIYNTHTHTHTYIRIHTYRHTYIHI